MDAFLNILMGYKPLLPKDFHTEHFSNEELTELLSYWGGGNTLNDPTYVGEFAEHVYKFKDDKEYFADPDIKMMWRDGLGSFLIECWKMVEKKHNIDKQQIEQPIENQTTEKQSVECNVCRKTTLCEEIENPDPSFEHFFVCFNCNGHGYMTNLGWNVGE